VENWQIGEKGEINKGERKNPKEFVCDWLL
jgi:hypothetical protein